LCGVEVVHELFSTRVAVNQWVVHGATKHGDVVVDVRISHRGHVEDASGELEARLALFDCAVGLGRCNAKCAESAYLLGFIGEPGRCSVRFAQHLVWQEAVSHLLDVELVVCCLLITALAPAPGATVLYREILPKITCLQQILQHCLSAILFVVIDKYQCTYTDLHSSDWLVCGEVQDSLHEE